MVEIGQDPWIGPKLGSLLSETGFDVLESNEKYLDYGKKMRGRYNTIPTANTQNTFVYRFTTKSNR